MRVWKECHEPNGFGGFRRVEWPDEGGLMGQAQVTIDMFGIVTDAVLDAQRQESKSNVW